MAVQSLIKYLYHTRFARDVQNGHYELAYSMNPVFIHTIQVRDNIFFKTIPYVRPVKI